MSDTSVISRRAFLQFVPIDIHDYLKAYERVQPYQEETKYEEKFVDDGGYTWRPMMYTFRERDEEEKSDDSQHLFVAKTEHSYVCYFIDMTDEQQKELEPFCTCAYHDPAKSYSNQCRCCIGCLHTEFAQQENIVRAIRAKNCIVA